MVNINNYFTKKYARYIVMIIALVLCVFWQLHTEMDKNGVAVENIILDHIDGKISDREAKDSFLALKEKGILHPDDKLGLLTNLTIASYNLGDYAEAVATASEAIYLSQSLDDQYYTAANEINLAGIFVANYDFKSAKELLAKALSQDIPLLEDEVWIKETVYIELAKIMTKEKDFEGAQLYLSKSWENISEDAIDYDEIMLQRHIIQANIYWEQGKYGEAARETEVAVELSKKMKNLPSMDKMEVKELVAKSEIMSGDRKKGFEMCDEIINDELGREHIARSLSFINDIVNHIDTDTAMKMKLLVKRNKLQEQVISANNEIIRDYFFSINNDQLSQRERTSRNIKLTIYIIVDILVIIALLIFLSKAINAGLRDALTGVYNRSKFDYTLKKKIKGKMDFALILMDIDDFKKINDTYGHEFGDEVLRGIGDVLLFFEQMKNEAFRVGGEEFCILLNCNKRMDAINNAELIRLKIQSLVFSQDKKVTVSMGVAFKGQSEDLYKLADEYLYTSKKNGKNQVTYNL